MTATRPSAARGEPSSGPDVDVADAAWVVVLPWFLLTCAAVALLASALGSVVVPSHMPDYWPGLLTTSIWPEPTEQARYFLAVAAAAALAGAIWWSASRGPRMPRQALRPLVWVSQLLALVFVVGAGVVAQHFVRWGGYFYGGSFIERDYFTWTSIAVAAAFALLAATAAPRAGALVALLRETSSRRVLALAVAALATAVWLLVAINTDGSLGNANDGVLTQITIPLDEAFAILNGLATFVDYHATYTQLWPYVPAAAMALLGATLTVYTVVNAAAAGLALLALFDVLRRVVGSSLGALALYLPLLATGFFTILGPPDNRYGPVNLFSVFPGRYGGPYLLAWLTARHLDGVAPRRVWLLFVAAGLVLLNNVEFGLAALGATFAALLWAGRVSSRTVAVRLVCAVAIGLCGAFAITTAITLVVAGAVPKPGWLMTFARLVSGGYGLMPMPNVGLHLAFYATFVAAIATATVRAVRRDPEVLLTGMLAWSGVFGLGAGIYYVGESHPWQLVSLFSSWALALVLLVVVAARSAAARASRLPRPAEVAVLFGFGLALCSLAQVPAPWTQIERISHATATPVYTRTELERYVARETVPGEHVAILTWVSHRVAYDAGVTNVSPYAALDMMFAQSQFDETLDRLRDAGGRTVFMPVGIHSEVAERLRRAGFAPVNVDTVYEMWRRNG